MKEDEFFIQVSHALSGCPLVEQELKLYITSAFQLIKKCLGHRLVFNMTGEKCENYSLERLIGAFKDLNDNTELIKRLNKFRDERNFLSHKGISHCLDFMGDLHHSKAEEFTQRLENIKHEANELTTAIHEEAGKHRGYLWFEDIVKKES